MMLVLVALAKNIRNAVGDNMSDKKMADYDALLADTMLRVAVLEKLLLDKGIFTREELSAVTQDLVDKATKIIMDKIQSSENLNDFVEGLANSKNNLKN
jgi:hypothetical protein